MRPKTDQKLVNKMQLLYANGLTIREISELTGVAKSTCGDQIKGTARIPKDLQKNPFELLKVASETELKEVLSRKEPTARNLYEAGIIKDIDYIKENHIKGERLFPDLPDKERWTMIDSIPLDELKKIMDTPTDYHSPLHLKDWADKYLAGRELRFLTKYPHKWCNTQYEVFDLFEQNVMLMVETFRDLGKTVLADGIMTHEICEHRDNCYFIMSETELKAGFRVKHIADILMTNRRLIADYGFLPATGTTEGIKQLWRTHRFTIKRDFLHTDPTLIAFSSEGTIATGMHFAGGIFDDVWSFKLEQNCQKNKDKWLGWYDGELEGCMEHAWELWLLTRKGPTDLYQDVEDRQFHVVFKRPAILTYPIDYEIFYKDVKGKKVFDRIEIFSDDGEISEDGNGRFTMEYFLTKKAKMAADKFESEYQLDPISSKGRYWKRSDLRYIDGYTDFYERLKSYSGSRSHRIIGFMDLGFGKKERSDFTALVILALWEHRYYLLESYIKRGASNKDIVEMCREAKKIFSSITEIFIEEDLQQTFRVQELAAQIPFVLIQGFSSRQEMNRLMKEDSAKRANLEGKALRIWCQIEDPLEKNIFHINKYMNNIREWVDEFNTFPSCKHFDLLDATGNAIGVLNQKPAMFFVISGL